MKPDTELACSHVELTLSMHGLTIDRQPWKRLLYNKIGKRQSMNEGA
jgi:hypothetical protein